MSTVKHLSFQESLIGYEFKINARIEKDKAWEIADLLNVEEVKAKIQHKDHKRAKIKAEGSISGKAMRCIIDILAR